MTSESLPHTCRCGARWSGQSVAHCAARDCHHTFTGPTSFDAHRTGGLCLTPASAGLVEHQRAGYRAWGYPPDPDAAERFRALKERNEEINEGNPS